MHSKRLISLILVAAMLLTAFSVCTVGVFTATAAEGDTVYVRMPSGASTPNCYMWNSTSDTNGAWPGVAMTSEGDNVYSYVPAKDYSNVIFNYGSSQTDDLVYPGKNKIFDYSSKTWSDYDISAATPVIELSKKDGSSFKTDSLEVTITVKNAESAYYTVDGGAQNSFTSTATVTLGTATAVDSTVTLSVSATNANGTETKTAVYTKKAPSGGGSGSDGSTEAALSGHFSTNPDGNVGKAASITIDGSISDWNSSMLIAQGVANDDPRVYRPNSMYEIAIDDYALYAAWDDTNLYLMWEMCNVQDAVAPNDNYPLSQGNLWINNLPVFIALSTDNSIEGDGSTSTDATVWNSGITYDPHVDAIVAFSTNGANGPFIYKAGDDGKIVYNETRQSGISLDWGNETISTSLWGIDKAYGTNNSRVPGDVIDDSSAWVDFYAAGSKHSKSLDMFYEMSIPLDLLDISRSQLESDGIGLMKLSTFGTSAMNSLPADPSMWDNADKPYSGQDNNSQEKEDADHITVPFARIGAMLSGGTNPPKPTVKPTEPSTPVTKPTTVNPPEPTPTANTDPYPSSPSGEMFMLGDADLSDEVNVRDATAVQKHAASISLLTGVAKRCADVNGDSQVNIKDATAIQKYSASIAVEYKVGSYTIAG